MESVKLGPRVKVLKEENDSNNLTLGPSLRDSITKRLRDSATFLLLHPFAMQPGEASHQCALSALHAMAQPMGPTWVSLMRPFRSGG